MKHVLAIIGLILSLLPLQVSAGGKLYFYHNDNRGAPVKMTDPSGKVVWSATYDPHGNAVVNEDPDGDGTKVENDIRLPGQYADEESSLHYNYFRTYDPKTGRYLTSDPIGLGGGLNPFAYALNNPNKYTDRSGLFVQVIAACAVNPACAVLVISTCYAVIQTVLGKQTIYNEECEGDSCPIDLPEIVPDFDPDDPTKEPVGQDGEPWPWKGQPPQGGDKGGYKNPNGPESLHPDLDHGGEIGPHWDFNDRKGPGYRIGPGGIIWPK